MSGDRRQPRSTPVGRDGLGASGTWPQPRSPSWSVRMGLGASGTWRSKPPTRQQRQQRGGRGRWTWGRVRPFL